MILMILHMYSVGIVQYLNRIAFKVGRKDNDSPWFVCLEYVLAKDLQETSMRSCMSTNKVLTELASHSGFWK